MQSGFRPATVDQPRERIVRERVHGKAHAAAASRGVSANRVAAREWRPKSAERPNRRVRPRARAQSRGMHEAQAAAGADSPMPRHSEPGTLRTRPALTQPSECLRSFAPQPRRAVNAKSDSEQPPQASTASFTASGAAHRPRARVDRTLPSRAAPSAVRVSRNPRSLASSGVSDSIRPVRARSLNKAPSKMAGFLRRELPIFTRPFILLR